MFPQRTKYTFWCVRSNPVFFFFLFVCLLLLLLFFGFVSVCVWGGGVGVWVCFKLFPSYYYMYLFKTFCLYMCE